MKPAALRVPYDFDDDDEDIKQSELDQTLAVERKKPFVASSWMDTFCTLIGWGVIIGFFVLLVIICIFTILSVQSQVSEYHF